MPRRKRRLFFLVAAALLLALALLLPGCRALGYYAHVAGGHGRLMAQRVPIPDVIERTSDPALRARLQEVLAAREFASARLRLPRNGSYTDYVALDRPYVSWNVIAAPEFSTTPVPQCFPFAGCVAYRGYFDVEHAQSEAKRLQAQGLETHIGPVVAYSTLGWFDDPVLSSMLAPGADDVVGLVFHELAHQWLYVPDDTAFNESLAMFVQRQGLREWRATPSAAPMIQPARDDAHDVRFACDVVALGKALTALYATQAEPDQLRRAKADAIAAFRERHRERRRGAWADDARYDAWIEAPINNAKIAAVGVYGQWIEAFATMYRDAGQDWQRFHDDVEALSKLDKAQRDAKLTALGGVDECGAMNENE